MNDDAKKNLCRGCCSNFYNRPGNSTTGECWLLKNAKVVDRTTVGTWQEPPYIWKPVKTLNCHYHEQGLSWIDVDDVRIVRKEVAAQ